MLKDGVDRPWSRARATLPYAIPNLQRLRPHRRGRRADAVVALGRLDAHRLTRPRRSSTSWPSAAGKDPLEIRQQLLAKHPRHLGVLNLAAEKAGWGTPLPEGKARGIAVHESFKSFVAQVVEVSIGEDGLPKVERVVCAVDCGIAINPDIIRAQMEGGIGYGLSGCAVRRRRSRRRRRRAVELPRLRVLRINEMPKVEVYIVPSTEKPTGVGEPGVPPIAPAVANAWAKLTGQRIRDLARSPAPSPTREEQHMKRVSPRLPRGAAGICAAGSPSRPSRRQADGHRSAASPPASFAEHRRREGALGRAVRRKPARSSSIRAA